MFCSTSAHLTCYSLTTSHQVTLGGVTLRRITYRSTY